MSPKRIERLMQQMSESLKEKDLIKDFPSILDDLEYIVRTYQLKIDGLTEKQRINHIYDIEYYKTDFLAELMKKYMELTFNKKFSHEINEVEIQISSGGYIEERDTINLTVIGLILNSENIADTLKRITHEYRHQYFFHFMHEKSIEGILDYPPYFIKIAKNYIPKPLNNIYDEEKKIVNNQYYRDNHRRMYTEIDADNFGITTIRKFLLDIYKLYPNKNKRLEAKVNKIQQEIIKQSEVVEKNLREDKRLAPTYFGEIYLKKPISSTLLVNGKEIDSLLYADKTLKNNPILKDKYEVFNILMNDYEFKSYHELIFDKYKAIDMYENESKINAIYENIINTDPIVLMNKLVEEKDIDGINKFLSIHPTFKDEYKEEIDNLFNTIVTDSTIINLLSKEESVIMKKERN